MSETSVNKTDVEKLVVNCADCQTSILTTVAKHEALLNRINEKKPAGSKRQTTIAYRLGIIGTGFPHYSRGLRSYKNFNREYQNHDFKPKIDK